MVSIIIEGDDVPRSFRLDMAEDYLATAERECSDRCCFVSKFQGRMKKQLSRGVLRKNILKKCSKFTGEYPRRSAISIKLLCNFTEITLRQGCFPIILLHIFRASFPKNTSTAASEYVMKGCQCMSIHKLALTWPSLFCSMHSS